MLLFEVIAKQETHFEFGGPFGVVFVMLSLPVVIYGLYFICNEQYCFPSLSFSTMMTRIQETKWVSSTSIYIYVCWMSWHVLLAIFLPGETAQGLLYDPIYV